jgi:ubiquinone/menaquinone biosynthesis C-methylase UbiE
MDKDQTRDAERIRRETEFHDERTHRPKTTVGYYDVGANWHALGRLLDLLGDLRGKKVLEFGCGQGWLTVDLARIGGEVHAFDISEESLNVAREYATQKGVGDKIHLKTDNAEALSYQDDMFDVVAGGGILHHLDLEAAFGEIHRVLKPGGKAFFLEPLGHNPLINLYRKLTPEKRTPDEHPLLVSELGMYTSQFSQMRCEYFYLLALLAFPFMIVAKSPFLFKKSLNMLSRADDHFLRLFPLFRRYCWSVIMILEKR